MLETGGFASESEKNQAQNPTILRFNVASIQQALTHISKFDSNASIIENDWGSIIRIMIRMEILLVFEIMLVLSVI
jgi:lactoylglutathione lyase